MHAFQSLNGLELHNYESINDKVEPLRPELSSPVEDRDLILALKGQALQLKLYGKRILINGLMKARP